MAHTELRRVSTILALCLLAILTTGEARADEANGVIESFEACKRVATSSRPTVDDDRLRAGHELSRVTST